MDKIKEQNFTVAAKYLKQSIGGDFSKYHIHDNNVENNW